MTSLLWKASFRHLLRHPWQLALAVLGVALGVAVVVGIDVANGSAQRAFELSSEALSGRTTHQIVGSGGELPEDLYRKLRADLGLNLTAPVVEGHVGHVDSGGEVLLMLGVDPFAEAPFRDFVATGPLTEVDLGRFLTLPGATLLSPDTAERLSVVPGERFEVDIGGAIRSLELVGSLQPSDESQRAALSDLVIVDIATAQEVLGLTGRLSRIDLIRPPEMTEGELTSLVEPLLPPGAELMAIRSDSSTVEQMTRAFRLNLQALSLLALLCGGFLIYNTMTFAVVQRRPLLAILRALGTTRRQVFRLMLGEALLIGIVGTIVGELAGLLLGQSLTERVTQTINDLYFVVNVRQVSVAPWTLVKGGILGLAATAAAAITPSLEATNTEPREALVRSELEARVHRAIPLLSRLGALLLATGGALLALPGKSLWLGFFGLFAVLVGFSLLTPLFTKALMAAAFELEAAHTAAVGD